MPRRAGWPSLAVSDQPPARCHFGSGAAISRSLPLELRHSCRLNERVCRRRRSGEEDDEAVRVSDVCRHGTGLMFAASPNLQIDFGITFPLIRSFLLVLNVVVWD